MEIVTDLVKKMSINGDLDTGDLTDKVSDQFGTVESSRQLDYQAFGKGRSSFMRTQSEGDLNRNEKMDWPMREEIGKRKKKQTACWLEFQSSQLEEKRSRLYSRFIRKSNTVNDLLYSPRNVEVVREQMLQVERERDAAMEAKSKRSSVSESVSSKRSSRHSSLSSSGSRSIKE